MGESESQGVDALPATEEIVVTSDAPQAGQPAPDSTTPDPEGKPARAEAKATASEPPAKQDTDEEDKDKRATTSASDAAAAKREADSPAKKRIDTLTAKLRDAERLAAYERGRREELERQAAAQQPKPADPDPKPKLDDFESADEYADKLADWKLRQKEAAKATGAEPTKGKQPATQDKAPDGAADLHPISKTYAAAKARHDDLDDVIADPTRPFTKVMADTLADDPNALEVLYRLGQDVDELTRVSKLPPHEQRRHVTRLAETVEAELQAESEPQPEPAGKPAAPAKAGAQAPDLTKVPAAPAAPSPISGRAVADRDLASLSDAEYVETMNAKEVERRKRG